MAENQDKEKRTKKDSNDNENDPFNYYLKNGNPVFIPFTNPTMSVRRR